MHLYFYGLPEEAVLVSCFGEEKSRILKGTHHKQSACMPCYVTEENRDNSVNP
jgi:hypothetical protein